MSATFEQVETQAMEGAAESKDTSKKNWLLLVFILLALLVASFLPLPNPLINVSICGLVLFLAVIATYRIWLLGKKLNEALKESHYEKFRRIEGLYHTMSDAIGKQAEKQELVTEFESQLKQLEADAAKGKYEKFTRDDAPDLVHNLHLALLQIATVDFLHFYIQSLESDYRRAVGPTAYDAYLAAVMRKPTDPPLSTEEHERTLRAEATFLANDTRRQQLLKQHVESTRQGLLKAAFRSWWWNIIPLMAVIIVFLVCLYWVRGVGATGDNSPKANAFRANSLTANASATNSPKADASAATPTTGNASAATSPLANASSGKSTTENSQGWTAQFAQDYLISHEPPKTANVNYSALFQTLMIAAFLASAGIAGATGGLMSVIQRVQASVPESDATTNLWALSEAETAVFFAPVTGLIFAIVLSFLFAGGVLEGTVFPHVQGQPWFSTILDAKAFALWLVWAFLAGFSERLVPDALDALARQQSDLNSKSPSPASARSLAPQAQEQSQKEDKNDSGPILDPHPDSVLPTASELTVTGRNMDAGTVLLVGERQPEMLESNPTSLRVRLNPAVDLNGKSQISVVARNDGAGGRESNRVNINVDEQPGG